MRKLRPREGVNGLEGLRVLLEGRHKEEGQGDSLRRQRQFTAEKC